VRDCTECRHNGPDSQALALFAVAGPRQVLRACARSGRSEWPRRAPWSPRARRRRQTSRN